MVLANSNMVNPNQNKKEKAFKQSFIGIEG